MLQVKNKFMSIFHHKQEKYTFVELVWTKYTEEMTVLEYRECVQKYLEIMLSIKPKQVLIETKLFFSPYLLTFKNGSLNRLHLKR